MVDDNEVLDWGNDEEDISEPALEPPTTQAAIFDDDDDPEDNISLGDEDEEEQYTLQAPEAYGHTYDVEDAAEDRRSPLSPPSQRNVDDARTAQQANASRAGDGGASKSARTAEPSHRSAARSAPRTPGHSSRLVRPIHALPAKPTSRPVGMPPHVEAYPGATPMVTETPRIGRDAKRANGAASKASPISPNDRPSKGSEEDRRSRDGDSSRYSDSYNHPPPDSDRRVQNSSVPSRHVAATFVASNVRKPYFLLSGHRTGAHLACPILLPLSMQTRATPCRLTTAITDPAATHIPP